MALQIKPYALTTLQNVKDLLVHQTSEWDAVLTRLINGATDWIEAECDRQFASRTGNTVLNTYAQEVYDGGVSSSAHLQLRQFPVVPGSVSGFQYRTGTPDAPYWTDFPATNFELQSEGRTGEVRVYGGLPYGTGNVRVTYVAGYAVDWANQGGSTHRLPSDLTDLCERMVIRRFKQRESYGKSSEGVSGGASVSWRGTLEEDDTETIAAHSRRVFV